MTYRQDQIISSLKRSIAQVLERDVADPRIRGLISVTQVTISPDRRRATVSVSILPEKYESRTIKGLNAAAGHIQSKVIQRVKARMMPRLSFCLDESLKKQAEILASIREGIERENKDLDREESAS